MHQPTQHSPTASSHAYPYPLRDLFIGARSSDLEYSAVPHRWLESGDSLSWEACGGMSNRSWQAALSSITTVIATRGPVTIEISPKIIGTSRFIELSQFDSLTLWPGTMYGFRGETGELLRISRAAASAYDLSKKSGIAYEPPTSGYSQPPRSQATQGEGDEHVICLDHSVCPGFEIRHIRGFTTSSAHYHKTFSEAYHVVDGFMTVSLSHGSGESHTQRVHAGETVVIPREIIHKVEVGSPDNHVLVSYWPRFLGPRFPGDSGDLHHVAE